MSDIVHRIWNKYLGVNTPAAELAKDASAEIESLRQQLAEKDAEIERLNSKLQKQALDCIAADGQAFDSWQQLAASQAREQQLRELIDKANGKLLAATMCHPNAVEVLVEEAYQVTTKALAIPTDTSALEAIKAEVAAKAGEVMRKRCAAACLTFGMSLEVDVGDCFEEEIRALPGVTMGDLK